MSKKSLKQKEHEAFQELLAAYLFKLCGKPQYLEWVAALANTYGLDKLEQHVCQEVGMSEACFIKIRDALVENYQGDEFRALAKLVSWFQVLDAANRLLESE